MGRSDTFEARGRGSPSGKYAVQETAVTRLARVSDIGLGPALGDYLARQSDTFGGPGLHHVQADATLAALRKLEGSALETRSQHCSEMTTTQPGPQSACVGLAHITVGEL